MFFFLTEPKYQGENFVGDHQKVIEGKRTDFMEIGAGFRRPKFAPFLTILVIVAPPMLRQVAIAVAHQPYGSKANMHASCLPLTLLVKF